MRKILVIQTAFIGDVVLATAVVETLHQAFPTAQIDFVLRKGNEGLLQGHPFLGQVWVWDKKQGKTRNLIRLGQPLRQQRYDWVINLQRFFSSGLLTLLSRGKWLTGYQKNPLSPLFHERYPHQMEGEHETDRNHQLLRRWVKSAKQPPRLYPSPADYQAVRAWQQRPYLCLAPTSVWFTKQFAAEGWVALMDQLPDTLQVYLLGAPGDVAACEQLAAQTQNPRVRVLAGQLTLLASAALMQKAVLNYVNDSAPLHFCSAIGAPVCAIFCSTVPAFGFGPLGAKSWIVQTAEPLACRPCGLHGHRACPKGHFRCATSITTDQLLAPLRQALGE